MPLLQVRFYRIPVLGTPIIGFLKRQVLGLLFKIRKWTVIFIILTQYKVFCTEIIFQIEKCKEQRANPVK